ncbi:hypothetical protein [uncultured Sulfitobacter sp.]|uniref:hypothetical protein n=1 Tax=uncultured Sulfitobacter sp. TaxID=191468 RepID=UPI0030FAD6AE
MLSTRKALLNKTIDFANEVHGLLKVFGLRLPKTVQHGCCAKRVVLSLDNMGLRFNQKSCIA